MKLNLSPNVLLLILTVSCVLFSCSERLQVSGTTSPDKRSGFSLAEIKRSFELDYAGMPQTRADGEFDESEILSPGWIIPLWDSVSVYYGEHLFQAGVVFEARYGYRLLRWGDTGQPELFPMPSRLIVLKDPDTDGTASYLRFLIPEANDVASDAGTGFLGLVLYTLLSGCPVSIGKFSDGVLTGSASLWDDSRTREETVDEMVELLQGIYVARVRPRASTRAIIPPVEIVGKREIVVNVKELLNVIIPPIEPPLEGIGGGDDGSGNIGGGGGGNSDSGGDSGAAYPNNTKITMDKPEVRAALDSLYNDCMGQLLINAIGAPVAISSGYLAPSKITPVVYDLPTGPLISGYNVEMGYRCDPLSVMEELMHVYQYQKQGLVDFRNAKINNEVEAKLAWYMYRERTGCKISIGNALGGHEGIRFFKNMGERVLANDLESPAFTDAYEGAVGALRNTKTSYRDEDRYPFDPGKINVENLLELLKDCINK